MSVPEVHVEVPEVHIEVPDVCVEVPEVHFDPKFVATPTVSMSSIQDEVAAIHAASKVNKIIDTGAKIWFDNYAKRRGGGFSPYRIDILNKSLSPYLTFSSEFEFLRDISPIDDPPSAKKVDFISAKISNIVNMGHGSLGSPLVFVCPEGRGPEGGGGVRD